ncbi:MAG: insulinase family protein [Candidatus Colwellbacteria bacterium]|nr:insulinase family protein [Candidatus Colwellbacteria bacterium]
MAFKKTTLKNGLRIITAPQPGSLAVTVLVLVETGSKYETKKINGISHFLEHMCFKGTKRRPTALQIATEMAEIGSEHNAFTAEEVTGYYIKAASEHIDKILDLLSDIYINQVFDAKEINKERGVIIGEIDMRADNPMIHVQDQLTGLLYGDQPAGWDIAGPKENIMNLTREDFVRYKGEHYVAGATSVVIAGGFNEEETIKKVEKFFAEVPGGKKAGKLQIIESQTKPAFSIVERPLDQIHIALGVRTFDVFDNRRFALEVLSEIMGGGMSSRLFHKVREELGAAYYVKSGTDFLTDHGYMTIFAGLDKAKFSEAVKVIMAELQKAKSELVLGPELQKAKNSLEGKLILGLETSDELAAFYGLQEILKKEMLTPEEIIQKVKSVTAEEVKSVARDIFVPKKLNLLALGAPQNKDLSYLLQIS